MGRNTEQRAIGSLAVLFVAVSLTMLSACSDKSEPETAASKQPTPTVQTSATGAVSSAPAQAETANPDADTNDAPPPQVSETDDGAETVAEPVQPPGATPTLRLASVATPEPKPAPSSFKEGVHYQRLSPTQPTSASPGQIEIVEVFWYGCPHCFALDTKLESWRQKNKANYIVFQRVPAATNDAMLFHGRVFYAAEQLGKLEELHTPIFHEIHLNANPLNTMDKTKAFFVSHGLTPADFDKTFASLAVENKLQSAILLAKRYRVSGVPFFIVNGKFTADLTSAGGEEQLLQLLNELATREHGG